MKLPEILYCMIHPGKAIEAKAKKAEGADLAAPPPGVAIEDFLSYQFPKQLP